MKLTSLHKTSLFSGSILVAGCVSAPNTPQRYFGTKLKEIFASDDPCNNVSKPVLKTFALCMARQPALASQVAGGAPRAAFQGARLKPQKISYFWCRICWKNSSVSSLYANQAARKIDPAHKMKLAKSNQLLGDFGGARLHVMGAGLLSNSDAKNKSLYRDPKTMLALANF